MTLKELCNKHKDGFTLDLETGLLVRHETGYYVSITNFCDSNPNFGAITKAYSLVIKNLGRKAFIGGWSDGEKFYIDISIYLSQDTETAIAFGKLFNQKAIWSCEKRESINI